MLVGRWISSFHPYSALVQCLVDDLGQVQRCILPGASSGCEYGDGHRFGYKQRAKRSPIGFALTGAWWIFVWRPFLVGNATSTFIALKYGDYARHSIGSLLLVRFRDTLTEKCKPNVSVAGSAKTFQEVLSPWCYSWTTSQRLVVSRIACFTPLSWWPISHNCADGCKNALNLRVRCSGQLRTNVQNDYAHRHSWVSRLPIPWIWLSQYVPDRLHACVWCLLEVTETVCLYAWKLTKCTNVGCY